MSLLGLFTGFYGYLFPGNINLMVLELYHKKRYKVLFYVTMLILAFEGLYCYFTLKWLNEIHRNDPLINRIELSACILSILMGIWMIMEKRIKNKVISPNIYRGLLNIIIHPQQIPFWICMGVLFQLSFINTGDAWSLNKFVFFNLAGTLLVMSVYSFFGDKLIAVFNIKMHVINKLAGILYVLIGITSLINH